jgi:cyclic pyranopterin phosphate synthase
MNETVADLIDQQDLLIDQRNRPLRDLRISLTDKCNFRCPYCMPKEIFKAGYKFLDQQAILSASEIVRLALIFKDLGINKIRLTGGEPTLRNDLLTIISELAKIPDLEIAMTTNGTRLDELALPLREAGLNRITVSLDAVDAATFEKMNDVSVPLEKVLSGLESARKAGFSPIKINTVVRKNWNDKTIIQLINHFRNTGDIVRFIEYMDVGSTNGWNMSDTVPTKELLTTINNHFPIAPTETNYVGEVAKRYQFIDGSGEIGFITSVTQPFCGTCTRARVSADGKLYTCLFSTAASIDLASLLRAEQDNGLILEKIGMTWENRSDRYSEIRSQIDSGENHKNKVEMSYIGG